MSFPAQVFRILIASPSDVSEEREVAVRTIQEWNDLNAAERQIVVLPLRWESHSAPEYGKAPQEVINRQVVDNCDLLVGIFWTRVGSPTEVADSGTIEEIERVATDGKPVMLYFSKIKQCPDDVDIDQLMRLRDFKKKTFPKALIESYGTLIEFKDKLAKQLEIQLRTLLAERSEGELGKSSARPITDIILHFADPQTGEDSGTVLKLNTAFLDISKMSEVPDYSPSKPATVERDGPPIFRPIEAKKGPHEQIFGSIFNQASTVNKDYFRQSVIHLVVSHFFVPLRFWLKNRGAVGARDVYIDITIRSASSGVIVVAENQIPTRPPTKTRGTTVWGDYYVTPNIAELFQKGSKSWRMHFEIPALQPQRELSPGAKYFLGAKESCEITVASRIYADTLAEPSIQELKIELKVERTEADANDVVDMVIVPDDADTPATKATTQN